jgi:uncharacterized protein YciI
MKHFVVEATYAAPIEKIRAATPRHRAFLQKGYDAGFFLMSGPREPPTGGFMIARAESREALAAMFAEEPFNAEGLATYTFKEFSPVKRQDWLSQWCDGG